MELSATLTKENFWNDMMEKYPKSMSLFCQWIDDYKKAVNWDQLFNGGIRAYEYVKNAIKHTKTPKFHDVPYAMQAGIWIEFCSQQLHHFFEQPEYTYSGDLAEDIKSVFEEIEEALRDV